MDWKGVIGTVAPWLSGALGSPLAGFAVSAVCDALGLSEKSETAIKQALAGATPEQMLALKNADYEFQLKMQELGFNSVKELEALAVQDRDSARKREIEVKDNTPKILAYAVTLGFFGVLTFMMMSTVPEQSKDILNIMLGSLGASWTGVISYYFGSTAGSKAKSELLAKATIEK